MFDVSFEYFKESETPFFVPKVSGQYNQRNQNDSLIPWTKRTLKELVQKCCLVLGRDVPPLKNPDATPPVFWDQTPADEALNILLMIYDEKGG